MSRLPDFFEKNIDKLERSFDTFDEDVVLIQDLATGTEETELDGIVVQQNAATLENFGDYDIEVKVLSREAPPSLDLGDNIRVERTGETYQIDGLRDTPVTIALECSTTTT